MSSDQPTLSIVPQPKGVAITRAQLHQPFTVNGSTETTMYAHKGYTMVYHSDALYCEYKSHKFIVPLANVVAMFI